MISGFAIEKGNDEIIIEGIYHDRLRRSANRYRIRARRSTLPQMMEIIDSFSAAAPGTVGLVGITTLFFIDTGLKFYRAF